jgi:hypothetical protein
LASALSGVADFIGSFCCSFGFASSLVFALTTRGPQAIRVSTTSVERTQTFLKRFIALSCRRKTDVRLLLQGCHVKAGS